MLDERTRHEMYLGLEEKLGTPVADALMKHLPPVGWADVATKHDLAALEDRMELRLNGLEERMALRIDSRIHAEVNRLLLFLFPTIISSLAIAVAVGQLG